MAGRNRMTFEKQLRDANKKRKADEKRAMKKKRKEQAKLDAEAVPVSDDPNAESDDAENGESESQSGDV